MVKSYYVLLNWIIGYNLTGLRRILSIVWITSSEAKVGVCIKRDFTRKMRHENDTLYFDQLIIYIPRPLKQNKIV
jgi:hypothetical protein